jgi:hypothetical protein
MSTENTSSQEKPTVTFPEVLNDEQALVVLINAARIGQSKGIYSLEEAELISKSIRHFTTLPETTGPVPTA